MADNDEQVLCPMCGFQFRLSEARETVCQRCPLKGSCGVLIKCPNCGYEIPLVKAPSFIGNLLSKLGRLISRQP
jgi:DNA-directed RNA polymerase subunit RPC12/RpoP